MTWLKLLPTWRWWLLAVLLVAGIQQARVVGLQGDVAQAKGELNDYRLQVAERDLRAAAAARAEEQRRQQVVDEVERNGNERLEMAQADAARAGDALQRLQQRFADSEQRSRACGDSITAQLGQAAEDDARMRADLLGRLGEAARLYAAEADERGVAGRTCEQAYDRVRGGG
ncbi:hypothetical protein D3C76_134670 [compost metagenome]